MALDPDLVAPGRTAIVLNELQRGTVGDRAALPMLVDSARSAVAAADRLVKAGRAAGIEVVHCVAASRVDFKGSMKNTVFAARARKAAQEHPRTEEELAEFAEVTPEIEVEPGDIVLSRLHGMSPMTDTGLDMILRNMGVSTIVAGGVSLNIGVTGLVIEAVNRAYDVVIARDACAGVPPEYGEMVLNNSLAHISRLAMVDELIGIWEKGGSRGS
jgi:nicotinamidase-related amidase